MPLLALFIVMLPKAHLTSHSKMSSSRLVTTPSWLYRSLSPHPPFFYSSSVYLCHLFLISSASVRPFIVAISVVYCAHLSMKYSLDIAIFLEEISSLSHSTVFLYFLHFFALFTSEGFLISPYYSLLFCFQLGISFPFFLAFHFSSFLRYL